MGTVLNDFRRDLRKEEKNHPPRRAEEAARPDTAIAEAGEETCRRIEGCFTRKAEVPFSASSHRLDSGRGCPGRAHLPREIFPQGAGSDGGRTYRIASSGKRAAAPDAIRPAGASRSIAAAAHSGGIE